MLVVAVLLLGRTPSLSASAPVPARRLSEAGLDGPPNASAREQDGLTDLNAPPVDDHPPSALEPAPLRDVRTPPRELLLNADGVARSDQFPDYTMMDDTEAHIAFFIQLSPATVRLAPRLIDKLWHTENVIVIHVDAKAPHAEYAQLRARFSGAPFSNVHFLPREPITYMGVSMLLNTLSAMEFLLGLPQRWDYFINLSGSDYPTVSVHNMRRLLGQPRVLRQRVSFMQLAPSKSFWEDMKKSRFDMQFADPALGLAPRAPSVSHDLVSTFKRHPLAARLGVTFLQAEAWIIGHRSLVRAAARGAFARRLLVLLSDMKDPEEHFFPMLAWNDPTLNRTLAHHAMRAVFWHLNGLSSGQHPFIVEDHVGEDGSFAFWPKIRRAPVLFARKFKTPDSPLMELIDRHKSGAHSDPDQKAVDASFRVLRFMTMCHADVERHWNSNLVVPCFKGGNLARN